MSGLLGDNPKGLDGRYPRPRRVIELTSFPAKGPQGGPVYVTRTLAESIRDLNLGTAWECLVTCPEPDQQTNESPVAGVSHWMPNSLKKWLRLPYAVWHPIRLERRIQRQLRSTLRESAADIVHAHDIYAFLAASRLLRTGSLGEFKLVLSVHSPGSTAVEYVAREGGAGKFPGAGFLEKWLKSKEIEAIKRADSLAFPSMGAAVAVLRDLGIDPSRVDFNILYNGVSAFRETSRGRLRSRIGVPSEEILIGCIARLVPEKGVDIAVQCLSGLRKSDMEVQMVILGRGQQEGHLKRQARELGLESSCHFVPRLKDAADFYADIDLLLSCNRQSAFDLTILEAMSLGVPVVATDVGGNREALGRADLIAPPGDIDALTERLASLLEDESARLDIGRYLKSRYETMFTLSRMAESALSFYQTVLESPSEELVGEPGG